MEGDLQIIFDGASTLAYFRKLTATFNEALTSSLEAASTMVSNVMREKASLGATGDLRASIGFKMTPENLLSEIKPSVGYGDAVETGSKPHWPPIAPLIPWAEMHGINPYALQRSISVKGTQPHPYIVPTFVETGPEVPPIFDAGIKTALEEARL